MKRTRKPAKTKLGVLVSGGGSNLQAIIDACTGGILKDVAEVVVVIANRADAFGLERARKHGIPAVFADRKKFADAAAYCAYLVKELQMHNVALVCLAGFLLKLEPNFVAAFPGRILNIHPALLPKFGGKGMYGHHVHEAVVAAGEKESGATVHLVDVEYDHGPAIIQGRVPVLPDDTPDALAARVLETEHRIYPEAILKVVSGKARPCL
jgi:phosphoribosylglycinamide formyltransferase-1